MCLSSSVELDNISVLYRIPKIDDAIDPSLYFFITFAQLTMVTNLAGLAALHLDFFSSEMICDRQEDEAF